MFAIDCLLNSEDPGTEDSWVLLNFYFSVFSKYSTMKIYYSVNRKEKKDILEYSKRL